MVHLTLFEFGMGQLIHTDKEELGWIQFL